MGGRVARQPGGAGHRTVAEGTHLGGVRVFVEELATFVPLGRVAVGTPPTT
jgi:hypothetical protein